MSILIINRYSENMVSYSEWLEPLSEELYLFTSQKFADEYKGFKNKKMYSNFYSNNAMDLDIIDQHKQTPFRKIIAISELDILRAALLREKLGIEGQDVESATAFRDKVIMKDKVKAGGFRVPNYKSILSVYDLLEFIDEFGYPIVIKPVDGMGSRNTDIIHNLSELRVYLEKGISTNLMVEEFIAGDVYHIDGCIINHQIEFVSAGRYFNNCLSYKENKGLGCILLSPDNPLYPKLSKYIYELGKCLPLPEFSSFHCEVFITPENELIFCEIASRTGGGRLSEAIKVTHGVDLNECWIKMDCDINYELERKNVEGLSGMYFVPKRAGLLYDLPDSLPFDWVVEYQINYHKNKRLNRNMLVSSDSIATVIFVGENENEVEERMIILDKWFSEQVIWRD